MDEAAIQSQDTQEDLVPEVLKSLIYEVLDGQPLFYQGYQQVLSGQKKPEDIMGTSGLQSLIISCVVEYLMGELPRKDYKVLFNELGLHIGKNNNFCLDIAAYTRQALQKVQVDEKYIRLAPQLVVEIDTKADLSSFQNPFDYFPTKTRKLLNYGVEEVIWIFSRSKIVWVARQDEDWRMSDWHKEIMILKKYPFTMGALLDEEGIQLGE